MNSKIIKQNVADATSLTYLIISIINFVLIVFGTVGNLFTFLILMRKNLRPVYSYTRYLSALCLIDIVCLYNWNFTYIYQDILSSDKKRIESYSPMSCCIFSYIAYSSLQLSSWIICVIGIDRIITLVSTKQTKIKKANHLAENKNCSFEWLKKKNPFQNTLIVIFFVSLIIFTVNIMVLIKNANPYLDSISNSSNETITRTFKCYSSDKFFKIWDIVHLLMYCLIPFIVIFTQNVLIAVFTVKNAKRMKKYELPETPFTHNGTETLKVRIITNPKNELISEEYDSIRSSKRHQHHKEKYVKNLLIFLTVAFFFTTLPYTVIYTTSLKDTFFQTSTGIIIKRCLQSLQYTRHAGSFLIYILTSSIIKKEINNCFNEIKQYVRAPRTS